MFYVELLLTVLLSFSCDATPIHIECGGLNPKNINYYCEGTFYYFEIK
jgi:hypothetical protein